MKDLIWHIVFFAIFFILPSSLIASNDWKTFKGNLYFTGNNDELIISSSNTKWTFTAESLLFHPVPAKNKIIIISLNKKVFCLNPTNGEVIWSINLKNIASHFGSGTHARGKIKYPILQENTLIVSDASIIFAINLLNGQIIWARAGAQELVRDKFVIDGIYSTPLISGKTVFYGSRKYFLARDLLTGHLIWHSDQVQTYNGFPTPYDKFILAQNRDYLNYRFEVVKLDANNGNIIWKKNIERPLILFSPVEFQNRVWVVSTTNLFSLDETNGTILRKFTFQEPITAQPGFSDRKLILSVGNRKLLQFDPKTENHQTFFKTDYLSSPHYVLIEDIVYLIYATEEGKTKIQALQTSTLKTLWEKQLQGKWYGSIPSAADKTLYVSAGNTLYAIGEPVLPAFNHTLAANNIAKTNNVDLFLDLSKLAKNTPIVLQNIYFEYNSSYLKPSSRESLDHLVEQLKHRPNIKLQILGHTDATGDKNKNQILSDKRANAVMEYLIKQGISPTRLSALGLGETSPIADNSTDEGRRKNRRTEFIIQ